MRLALLSDIHGNLTALDAVLADIAGMGGVDAYWILGDLVALGPDPVGVLERLAELKPVRIIRGNTDRYVAGGDRPPPTLEEVRADPALLPRLIEVAQTFTWTQGALAATGWLDWLKALPLELRDTWAGGATVLGVHASPGRDDGTGLTPDLSTEALAALVGNCPASLIFAGHTHRPCILPAAGKTLVNLGSVSLPVTADKRASYVLAETGPDRLTFRHRQVDYDRAAVVAALEAGDHPGRRFIIRHLTG